LNVLGSGILSTFQRARGLLSRKSAYYPRREIWRAIHFPIRLITSQVMGSSRIKSTTCNRVVVSAIRGSTQRCSAGDPPWPPGGTRFPCVGVIFQPTANLVGRRNGVCEDDAEQRKENEKLRLSLVCFASGVNQPAATWHFGQVSAEVNIKTGGYLYPSSAPSERLYYQS